MAVFPRLVSFFHDVWLSRSKLPLHFVLKSRFGAQAVLVQPLNQAQKGRAIMRISSLLPCQVVIIQIFNCKHKTVSTSCISVSKGKQTQNWSFSPCLLKFPKEMPFLSFQKILCSTLCCEKQTHVDGCMIIKVTYIPDIMSMRAISRRGHHMLHHQAL